MSKVTEKIREEIEALIPPALFFLIALHLLAIIRSLMLRGTGIPMVSSLTVTIGALIIAKAVLIADLLPIINLYPHKPLIWNVIWKTLIYTAIATFIHYLENLFDVWKQTHNFAAANEALLKRMVWAHFFAIEILLLLLVLLYCTIREMSRAIGRKKMMEMFFGASK